jgi:hypothetical protein
MRRFALSWVMLVGASALAQRAVVIDIAGDVRGKLRGQIEDAVVGGGTLEVIPLKLFRAAAGTAAKTSPERAVMAASSLNFDVAVGGAVKGKKFRVVILDHAGQQLWAKELKLNRGLLGNDVAVKLARAIVAAATPPPVAAEAPSATIDAPRRVIPANPSVAVVPEAPQPELKAEDVVVVRGEPEEERDADLEDPNRNNGTKAATIPVPIFRVWVAGTTTWRSQCLRPGVTTCKAYDGLNPKPVGVAIDFTAAVPYLGLSLNGELFPAARAESRILSGFGLLLGFHYGQSQTKVVEETAQGKGPDVVVRSQDVGFSGQLAWRFHFLAGYGAPQGVGHVGLRGGLQARSFLIDPTSGTALPSSQRTFPTGVGFPTLGFDAAFPIAKFFRIEASVSYFLNPRPGAEQITGYGNPNDVTGGATATGFAVEAGASGQIWGPLGYVVRWRYMGFVDRFFGQGMKWTQCNETQCGGAGEESFHSIIWGATVSY